MLSNRFLRYLTYFVLALLVFARSHVEPAFAATLTSVHDTMSNSTASATGVTHTLTFTTATTDSIKRITFRFSTTSGGSTKPAGLNLANSTLGATSGIGSGWTLTKTSANIGVIWLERGSATSINSGQAISIAIDAITNSAIADCEPSRGVLFDNCHVSITTYSDDGTTIVDDGNTSYETSEDPTLTFEVEGIVTGATHNGVTSSIDTSPTSISYGHFSHSSTARYATQKLTITTNAPRGYTIYAKLADSFAGSYGASAIQPFAGVNATWSTPQNWAHPNGTIMNSNTGWFGANTTDSGVTGWSSASGKFGPLGTVERAVATSTSPARSGTVIYVSFAFEVNSMQPADKLLASLVYDIRPIF